MARRRLRHAWAVCIDESGNMTILDERGERPLEAPDPVQRLAAYCMAAGAPFAVAMLEEMIRMVERLAGESYQWKRDASLIMEARAAIICSHPTLGQIARVTPHQEMDRAV